MLAYRRPGPPPGPRWWSRRSRERRVERWDGDELDGRLREYEAARRNAAPRTDFGWMSFRRNASRLEPIETAATATAARERAEKRFAATPEGWRLTLGLRPA